MKTKSSFFGPIKQFSSIGINQNITINYEKLQDQNSLQDF